MNVYPQKSNGEITLKNFQLPKFFISAERYILLSAAYITIILNVPFWQSILKNSEPSFSALAFIIALEGFLLLIAISMFSLILSDRVLRWSIASTFIISSMALHFNRMGIVFDKSMLTNMGESNVHETLELISLDYLTCVFIFGIMPTLAMQLFRITPMSKVFKLKHRLMMLAICILSVVTFISINFQYSAFFMREHRSARLLLNPFYGIYSLTGLLRTSAKNEDVAFVNLDPSAHQILSHRKPRIGVLVLGETARADHFSLNGYSRDTNPELEKLNIKSFKNVSSCGTSTAYSVPCMFSFETQSEYRAGTPQNKSNVLDVLNTAGVDPTWIDNNSSCKGVCKRIKSINLRENVDANSAHFNDGVYYDSILIDTLDQQLKVSVAHSGADKLFVLHPLGSHGPAYHKRYPKKFAKFQPECKSSSPHTCTQQEVINSYDNTILYTDYLIAQFIKTLEKYNESAETFLIYLSDHGESLGENGVYLHGLPLSMAPESQTHVPMVSWFSEDFDSSQEGTNSPCIQQAYSHDNLSHTLLGLFQVQSKLAKPSMNVFSSPCDVK